MQLIGDAPRKYCARCSEERIAAQKNKGKAARNQRYREKHRERLIARDHHRYISNREERLAQARAYYYAKKEKSHVVQ